ncbi:MAG: S8 family serine peptidase, partial [Candidatus Aegiribacteria sp.]|nr:S8 family serine peptidase [Candidatus Aegiribacteria sp.]
LSGAGVTVAICDTGIDANANNNADGHLDLRGRQAAFVDYTGGGAATDTNGHGTLVAGAAVGNAATGETEAAAPNDFLWGQGMAPQADYVTMNGIATHQGAPWPLDLGNFVRDAKNNNADIMNNSWWDTSGVGIGYTANSRRLDQLVRDADDATAILEPLAIVFVSGNYGGYATTITSPSEAKNIIVVGSSLTWRPGERFPSDDIGGISAFSGRGPAVDTRMLPNVVAPGQDVSSAFSDTCDTGPSHRVPIPGTGNPDPADPANLINQYIYGSGTSLSAPHVSGLCALLTEWWRNRTNGKNPSPALLKALLINGAEDLSGGENWCRVKDWVLHAGSIYLRIDLGFTPDMVVQSNTELTQVATLPALNAAGRWFYDNATDILYVRKTDNAAPGNDMNIRDAVPLPNIPNEHQGWGRVSLENIVLQHPDSDRGPRIFSDQRHAFTADGQEYMIRIAANDAGRPIRITLAWTDAPAAAGDNPSLENDLDLEVIELATGDIYMGNINFINGFSTSTAPGDAFDDRNNIECVYIENPNGIYEVRVIAGTLRRNARPPFDVATLWQDFALVLDNVEVPSAAPISVVPVIDRSDTMINYDYVDITRISSKQFVDLMSIDDQVAVVSFGSLAGVEYPTGAAPALQTITGQPVRDAANDEIDNISFGGCTYMGQGIEMARDLLNPAAGSKAMVLLSDGFDNKGCQETNAARPWAIDVAAALPADMPVYTCAMGPTSDQELLSQIAEDSDGRYYYMPAIDDLFEIYNYIRGQVTGDSIVVNDSATASSSRMSAFVDSLATEATFSISWAEKNIRFVPDYPGKKNEISVRLRDPHGRLLHSGCSYIRSTVGDGYVIFKLRYPTPGQWYIEVKTSRRTHVRYTVGGFVRSPLRFVVHLFPRQIVAGMPLSFAAQVFDGKWPISGFKATSQVIAPSLGIKGLLRRYRRQLRDIRPDQSTIKDNMPLDIVKLSILRNRMLQENKPDIFSSVSAAVPLRNVTVPRHHMTGLVHMLPPKVFTAGPGEETTRLSALPVDPVARVTMGISGRSTRVSGAMTGRFTNTRQQGSYNVIVTATGISPVSNTRFVRKEMVSVLIR